MFVINSEIIPVAYERGLSVLRLDSTTGAHETRVSILKGAGCHVDTTLISMHGTHKVSAEGHGCPPQGT